MHNSSFDIELENLDVSKLDAFEQYHLSNLLVHSNKVDALKIIINNTEGDFSQLSPDLKKIAIKYYQMGGQIGFESSMDALEYAYKIKEYYFGDTKSEYSMSLTEEEIMDYLLDSGYDGKDKGRFFDMVISSLVELGISLKMEYEMGGLPEMNLEDLVPVKRIYEEFDKYGYDAYDVVYSHTKDEALIIVSPLSKKFGGEFSKNFSQEMDTIRENIGASDYSFTPLFQVIFEFDMEKYPSLNFDFENGGDLSQLMALQDMGGMGMGMPKQEKKSDLELKLEYKEKERLRKEKEKKAKERSKKIKKFKGSIKKGFSNVFNKIKKNWDDGGIMDMPYADDYDGTYMTTESLVRSRLQNGEISISSLTDILGKTPDYPNQVVGSLLLKKCFLRPYYSI